MPGHLIRPSWTPRKLTLQIRAVVRATQGLNRQTPAASVAIPHLAGSSGVRPSANPPPVTAAQIEASTTKVPSTSDLAGVGIYGTVYTSTPVAFARRIHVRSMQRALALRRHGVLRTNRITRIEAERCLTEGQELSIRQLGRHGSRHHSLVSRRTEQQLQPLRLVDGGNGRPIRPADSGSSPVDERAVKLGKTVRILHDRLPTLLESPLPQDILSPTISLHLFPSTHPHLPTVTGRIPYTGALWTAPVAWGRLPVLGNVKIEILSQRMISSCSSGDASTGSEKLVVKWKTCSDVEPEKHTGASIDTQAGDGTNMSPGPVDRLTTLLRGEASPKSKPFCGLFIFEFDDHGRIAKHTIEHVEESRDLDQMPRVVSVTDWLLGRAPWRKKKNDPVPELAWCKTLPSTPERHE